MNAELQRVYDETPAKVPLSRLEPYKDLILRWRRDGRSYPAICQLLKSQFGVQSSAEPLRQYVLRRTRKRKTDTVEQQPSQPRPSPGVVPKRSAAEKAALRMAAKACNHHSTVVPREHQELFVFDEEQPLTNKPEESKWQQQR